MRLAAARVVAALAAVCQLTAEPAPTATGRVIDASGAPIPGAKVIATAEGKSLGVSTHSGITGEFAFTLAPGAYRIAASADGFQDGGRSIEVGTAAAPEFDLVLQIAPRADMVTVTETVGYQAITAASMKSPTPLIDVPQSVSIVTHNQIRDQAMLSMADVVRYVPGITMAQGEGHRDAPVIRGNATTADFYVNGVRDDVQYYRDLYNVERVEAVKGANALTFGRGGGGGVINRVTKEPSMQRVREVSFQGGAFGNRRVTADADHNFTDRLGVRINGVYENSDSFRREMGYERYGIAPVLSWTPAERTRIKAAYEYFNDDRTVDRGIPSFQGRPSAADRRTFFGDPDASYATAGVHHGALTLDQQFGRWNIRNQTTIADYDKFYQNVFPGAVNAAATLVSLSGYNNGTLRRNVFNQTDATTVLSTGALRHTIVAGNEFGRQRTNNLRNTAYFGNATSTNVPFWYPTVDVNESFRQSVTDADNYATNHVAAAYVQDQVEVTRWLQVVGGLRFDSFNTDFHNNRNNENLNRRDRMLSPRAGLIVKPFGQLSLYSSYSVAYLPSAGDQFSSLTATTRTLRPEKFDNYEAGAKWDVRRSLSLTAAVYRLDRTNTTARDPNDPAVIVQTGSQRTNGFELGVNGSVTRHWQVAGGYAHQDAFISSTTTAAARGAKVALVPQHTLSFWNNYQVLPRWSVGLGLIHQADMFAGIDNAVVLPSFTRADAATFYSLTETVRLQVNVENLADTNYYATAHSNNNIMPGAARTLRAGMIARF